ncbi:hypothetical protein HDV05_002754 [Chytridiales sp. JEL 0842]|nr:hypothetical protein HDV05_002754 [Chytridiales sp. JEL 0842]
MTVAVAQTAIQDGNWQAAALAIDDLLLQPSLSAEDTIKTYFAQAYLLLKLKPERFTLEKDDTPRIVAMTYKANQDWNSTRNSISYLMKGLEMALEKKNAELIDYGCNCFCQIASKLSITPSGFGLLLVPLTKVVESLAFTSGIDVSIKVALNITLVEMISETLEYAKAPLPNFGFVPWPSAETLQTVWKNGQDLTTKSLSSAGELAHAKGRHQLVLHTVNAYCKVLKTQPSWKCKTLDKLLKQEKRYAAFVDSSAALDAEGAPKTTGQFDPSRVNNVSIVLELVHDHVSNGRILEAYERLRSIKTVRQALKSRFSIITLCIDIELGAKVANQAHMHDLLQKLNSAISQALESECDPKYIYSGCMCEWKYLNELNLLTAEHRSWVGRIMKTLCRVSDCIGGFNDSVRATFEHELAKCYEAQNVFSLAINHAQKARQLCTDPKTLNEIDILIQKLWIKGNTFDGNLTPELKALSLVDQALYIPQATLALGMLEKALKTLAMDYEMGSSGANLDKKLVLNSFINNNFTIDFNSIQVCDPKAKGLVIIALSDLMHQAVSLARKSQLPTSDLENRKLWKLTLDTTSYILRNSSDAVSDEAFLAKLQAEALLVQGEALLFFAGLESSEVAESENPSSDEVKTWQRYVTEPLLQSFNAGFKLKHTDLVESATAKLWSYYKSLKSPLKHSAAFWMECFQKLYDGFLEIKLEDSDLIVFVATGYAESLKELHEQQTIPAVATEEKSTAAAKGGKSTATNKTQSSKTNQSSPASNLLKLAEDVCNIGLASKCDAYEAKLSLFNIRSSLRPGGGSSSETDIVMKLFSGLETLETQKKPSKDDLESVVQDLAKTEQRLSINLKFELWKRVIQHAIKTGQYHLSYECVTRLFSALPMNYTVKLLEERQINLNLVCSAEILYGQIILQLCELKIPFKSFSDMRLMAMSRLANAVEIACEAETPLVSEVIVALEVLNGALLTSQIPKTTFTEPIDRVLKALTAVLIHKGTISQSLQLLQDTIMSLHELLLEAYTSQRNWVGCIRMIENMFRIMPKALHRRLWEQKVQVLSQGRKGIAMSLLKEADAETQSIMWHKIGAASKNVQSAREAFEAAHDVLVESKMLISLRAEAAISLAQWLFTNGMDVAEIIPRLEDARFVLNEIKETYDKGKIHWQTLYLHSTVLKTMIEQNESLRSNALDEGYTVAMSIIGSLQAPAEEKPAIVTRKGLQSADNSEQAFSDRWAGFEWPPALQEIFSTSDDVNVFAKANITDPLNFVSSLLFLTIELEARGKLIKCLPLLCALELAVSQFFDGEQKLQLLSIIHLQHSNILSNLKLPLLARNNKLSYPGFRLNRLSLLLLKAREYLHAAQYQQAQTTLLNAIYGETSLLEDDTTMKQAQQMLALTATLECNNVLTALQENLQRTFCTTVLTSIHRPKIFEYALKNFASLEEMESAIKTGDKSKPFIGKFLECAYNALKISNVNEAQHWDLTIGICRLLIFVGNLPDLGKVSSTNKTLQEMIDEHFVPEEEKQLIKAWSDLPDRKLPEYLLNVPTWQKAQLSLVSIESLQEFPKGLKVLVLQHSLDKKKLYAGLIYKLRSGSLMAALNEDSITSSLTQYLEPLIKLLADLDSSQTKAAEKAESKKKSSKADDEEPDRGHCVICSDEIFESLPVDAVIRSNKIATSTSRDFGFYYVVSRLKSMQDPTKKKEKEKPSAEKGDNLPFKVLSDTTKGADNVVEEGSSMKFEKIQVDYSEVNEVIQQIDQYQGGVIAIGSTLSQHQMLSTSLSMLQSAPSLLVAISLRSEESTESFDRMAEFSKKLGVASLLSGMPLSIVPSKGLSLEECKAYMKVFSKMKDGLRIGEGMSDLENRRLVYSSPFFSSWGFLL